MSRTILFITPQLPYPPISGGTIVSLKMIDFLSKSYKLILVCQLKSQDDIENEEIFLKEYGKRLWMYKSARLSFDTYKRSFSNLLKSYFHNVPLSVYRNFNSNIRKYVSYLLENERIDRVLVDHYVGFQYIEKFIEYMKKRHIKIILLEHNAEYVIWERYAKLETNLIKKFLIKIEAERIKNYERKICLLSDNVLCLTENDMNALLELGLSKDKFKVITPVGDYELLNKDDLQFESTEESLLFVGTLSWEANIEGIEWFIKNVWKELRREFINLRLYIVGKNPPERLTKYSQLDKNIIFTGFVDDLEAYYKRCRVFVSPIRFGSGIKIKNINAMYRGIPLVTTSVGIEGINGEDGKHFYIADDEKLFKEKISILLKNKDKWYEISRNARQLAREKYSWDIILTQLREVIEDD